MRVLFFELIKKVKTIKRLLILQTIELIIIINLDILVVVP